MYFLILGLIFIISIIIFLIIVVSLEYIPKHYYTNIDLTKGIAISLVIAGLFMGYYSNTYKDEEAKKKIYSESIITSFDKIDDFLIENYDNNNTIIKILYQKIQFPSSDEHINNLFDAMTDDEKDNLFLIYNKITYILEKMFLVDPELFDNKNLGMRVRLYIDSIYYYEFWNNTQNLYKTEFVDFVNKKYIFLNFENSIYNKPNRNLNRYSESADNEFIYNSPKYSASWRHNHK
jgi:hypothetical protein